MLFIIFVVDFFKLFSENKFTHSLAMYMSYSYSIFAFFILASGWVIISHYGFNLHLPDD